jgi:small subunit ribosomal protein S6
MEERLYDLIFICMPTTPEEDVAKIVTTLEQVAAERGAKVEKLEKWGTRKLAYRVSKQREGYFVYMSLKATQGEVIKELERRLKVTDAVIKYMTIRLDEEIKRQQKLGSRREQRNRRRPKRPAVGAAPGAPSAPPSPAPPPTPAPSVTEPPAAAV